MQWTDLMDHMMRQLRYHIIMRACVTACSEKGKGVADIRAGLETISMDATLIGAMHASTSIQ